MAFQQLYYTSCEHGLAGYGGYQFNAVTPGVAPAVLREVEERTVYEPPRWLLADPRPDEPEAYPVAFSCGTSEATGTTIATHVVFTGADYSGRPGNYFVHALVTRTPEQDFSGVLPAELWGSALWHSRPVDGTDLPPLPGPPARGVIDRPGAEAFLDSRAAGDVLPELLTAVGRAMAGEPPVLMAAHDVTENAWWIAAVSYLLGEHLARRLTFTTYSHRPSYARYHLVGVLPGMAPPEAGFQVFDLAAGTTPGGAVHPLAALLASTGVMAAPGLWQQATVFASGTEQGLDDWLAPVVMAAGVLGRPLSHGEADEVAGWLPDAAGSMPAQVADVGLGVVLAQPADTLADDRLIDLLGLARRLPAPARAEHLERLLIARAIAHLRHGEQVRPVPLGGTAAAAAAGPASRILETAAPSTALAILEWAAASGVVLPDGELQRYGRARLDPAQPGPAAARLLRYSPAVLRGLLERLAAGPPQVTEELLRGPIGALLNRDDLAGHPELTELWLIQSVARGARAPLQAFDEIVDVRDGAQRSPRVDGALLRLLWPGGCPADDLTELLGALTDSDPPAPEVLDWFGAEIGALPARGTTTDDWLRLAQALTGHPVLPMLPEEPTRPVRNAVRILPLLDLAYRGGPQGSVVVFPRLFGEYTAADPDTRRLLEKELPALLGEADPLDEALRGCPKDVAAAFCLMLSERLSPLQADAGLARRTFAALAHPDVLAQPVLTEWLAGAFEQVSKWRRRDLAALGQAFEGDGQLAQSFQAWRDAHRGALTRKLLGPRDKEA
jgi:GTPase-associated protein 1, N-terminal domain type 2/GTPase-associated protein 1, C-terminal domain/GTPase-associated protein 1, middle domain